MPARNLFGIGALAVCCVVTATFGAKAPAAPPSESPVNVRFDALAGHFQQNVREAPCSASRVHTSIRIDKAYADPGGKWASVVQIIVNESEAIGVHASLAMLPADGALIELRKYSHGRTMDEIPFSVPASFGRSIDATLSWTADGSLSVTLNRNERHTIALGEPVRTVKFVASGAKAAFDDVQFDAAASARPCSGKRSDI